MPALLASGSASNSRARSSPERRCAGESNPASRITTAQIQEKYTGMPMTLVVDRVEPPHTLAFRWHPFAIDPDVDYSSEPMTLVTFTLEPSADGTLLTVVESGFDAIPLARRADAFEAND